MSAKDRLLSTFSQEEIKEALSKWPHGPTEDEHVKIRKLRFEDGAFAGTAALKPDECIQQAIELIVEARRHLTIGEFEKYIKGHIRELGGSGFLCSIGQAILDGATIDGSTVER